MRRQKLVFSAVSTAILAVLVPLALAQGGSPAGGTCPEFNGRNSFLILEAGKLVDTKIESVTVEAWIYLRSFPEEGERWVIAGKPGSFELQIVGPKADHPDPPYWYSFHFCTDGEAPPGKVGITWGGSIGWPAPMELGRWYHVSGSFEDSSAAPGVSIDGKVHISSDLLKDGDPGDLIHTHSPFYIGGKQEWGSYFDGFIDEVRISDVARYKRDFRPPRGFFETDGRTLALWHFDKDKGFLTDSSGNGNTLTGKSVGFLAVEPAGKLSATWACIKSER